jgi:hypothetical protein
MQMLAEEGIDGYVADNRFRKRDPQWKLYSMVHNIFKIYRFGLSYAH